MALFKFLFFVALLQFSSSANVPPEVTKTNSEFSCNLYYEAAKGGDTKNVIISPTSVQTILTMALLGANGETANEISNGLRYKIKDKNELASKAEEVIESISPLIKTANRIYVDKNNKVKADFNNLVNKAFKSEAENIDFSEGAESSKKINDWVESNTNNKIKDLVNPNSFKESSMILVNAIHFKGDWLKQFPESSKSDFWNDSNTKSEVDMMSMTSSYNYNELNDLDATAIELPYKESDMSMMILLPNKKDGLKNLMEKLPDMDLISICNQMNTYKVDLKMPKFEIEYQIGLKDVLQELGMKTMFTKDADFSDLADGGVHVGNVLHKAFIKVDENGAEAAAATGVFVAGPVPGMPQMSKTFHADHPFIFAIKDRNIIYFIGSVTKL